MGVRQYNLGKRHARDGIRAMAHRKLKQYDSDHAQQSYNNGYKDGAKERGGLVPLDYSKKLNNQLFV